MAYQSLTLHMLISAPSDVAPGDMRTVHRTINRWNFRSGRRMVPSAVIVVPVSWDEHAYSEFGIRPQESLNKQLVEEADLAFAMFADRLGTPTGKADSGTVEEMNEMRDAGKHVSIVRSVAPRSVTGQGPTEEKLRLETYLSEVKAGRGLVYEYVTGEDLAAQVEHVLSSQAERFMRDASASTGSGPETSVGVWPTAELVERAATDGRGRPSMSRDWYLVLTNATGHPVKNVSFSYEPPEGGWNAVDFDSSFGHHEAIPFMAPGGAVRFRMDRDNDSSLDQIDCIVSWQYDELNEEPLAGGPSNQTRATVRAI